MSSLRFLIKIKLAFGVGLVLLAMAGVASYLSIDRLIETAQSRVQAEDTLVLLVRVTGSLQEGQP